MTKKNSALLTKHFNGGQKFGEQNLANNFSTLLKNPLSKEKKFKFFWTRAKKKKNGEQLFNFAQNSFWRRNFFQFFFDLGKKKKWRTTFYLCSKIIFAKKKFSNFFFELRQKKI